MFFGSNKQDTLDLAGAVVAWGGGKPWWGQQ